MSRVFIYGRHLLFVLASFIWSILPVVLRSLKNKVIFFFFSPPRKTRHQTLCSLGMRNDLASPGQKWLSCGPSQGSWFGSVEIMPGVLGCADLHCQYQTCITLVTVLCLTIPFTLLRVPCLLFGTLAVHCCHHTCRCFKC